MGDINADDFAVGRIQRGLNPEEAAVVIDDRVPGIGSGYQPKNRRIRMREVLDGELIVGAGALGLIDQQVAAIVSDRAADV
jgi:hypothetical protein